MIWAVYNHWAEQTTGILSTVMRVPPLLIETSLDGSLSSQFITRTYRSTINIGTEAVGKRFIRCNRALLDEINTNYEYMVGIVVPEQKGRH
jgi:hypothetical protein